MKVYVKEEIFRGVSDQNLLAQFDPNKATHNFLLKLYYSFQTKYSLYLVVDNYAGFYITSTFIIPY